VNSTTPPRIHVLCEGQTEETVVTGVISPALGARGINVTSSLLITKRPAGSDPSFKGGATSWKKIRADICRLLLDSSLDRLTTFIDYYGFPADAPGMDTRPPGTARERVSHVEAAVFEDIGHPKFHPHLTLHETETWVLACLDSLESLAGRVVRWPLEEAVLAAGEPELVNDGPNTSPSKRVLAAWPGYSKVNDGPIVISDTGLDHVLSQCSHARAWFEELAAMSQS